MMMKTWTVSAKATGGSHVHYGEFSLLAFDETDLRDIEPTEKQVYKLVLYIAERRNPDCSAGIQIRQFLHQ